MNRQPNPIPAIALFAIAILATQLWFGHEADAKRQAAQFPIFCNACFAP